MMKRWFFEAGLCNHERAVIHELRMKMGMKSKSFDKGAGCHLTVWKIGGQSQKNNQSVAASLVFFADTRAAIQHLFLNYPPIENESSWKYDETATVHSGKTRPQKTVKIGTSVDSESNIKKQVTLLNKRPFCWMEHMSLDNVIGMDPPGVRVRPVAGLVAANYFMGGYFVWAVLIENLAKIGYEEKNLHMAAYDWRLSFQNTEVRDKTLSRLKNNIELLVRTNNGQKVVAVPHSMGTLYFLNFMKWVEAPAPMGGGGGPDWCAKRIKAVMNIAGPLLDAPKAVSGRFSAEATGIAVARAIALGVLDSESFGLQTLQHIMRVTRTWDSTMSMIPKGGEVIWGGLDWSPEEGYCCSSDQNNSEKVQAISDKQNSILKDVGPHRKPMAHSPTEDLPMCYRGMFHAASTIMKEEGPLAVYKGWWPSLISVIPYVGLNFAVYESLKYWLIKKNMVNKPDDSAELSVLTRLGCGAVAGTAGQTVAYPLDVIRRDADGWMERWSKTPVQYAGMVDTFRKTVQNEGFRS